MSTRRFPYLDPYWQLYLIKHGREDLLDRTEYLDADTIDVGSVPAGSLLLVSSQDVRLQRLVESGELSEVAQIQEPGDPPQFRILRRVVKPT